MSLLTIEEREAPAPTPGSALLALGFRPFYLLAAAFAAVSIPAWIASYYGVAGPFQVGLAWHVHEMMFGFVVAVVVGFLYTAGRNWTGLWTPRGAQLAAIAGLWIAGRVAMFAGSPLVAAVVDVAFLPVAAWPFYQVLKRTGNKRNLFLVALLGLLAVANALYHAAVLGWIDASPLRPVYAAIIVVVVIEGAIGGRVIPMFTQNGVGAKTVSNPRTDKLALGCTAAAGLAWGLNLPAIVTAPLALAAAVFQAMRLAGWKPLATLGNPLVWILHASYAWIPFGFLLLALSQLGVVPQSAAVHVLAVGALAGLILGMMTRTALGHTGRKLASGPKETAMYVLVQLGVVTRLVAALSPDGARNVALVAAAVCWSAAFALYVAVYGPYLCRPRIDGREG
ncbi:NnrS family protein [Massilia solisilvae]|uniref:NnrS family protein n=1 Tax=Massilia solisilvae TaxID=1811225 RepID=A0ABT2BPG2_9BURK|nr:NnrS family protein [Massilia solisilvae]MCS0610401.1 NnrS family protein [Massilia solisilvae]